MPEGPEIRIAADRIGRILIDKPLSRLFFAFPHLKRFEKILAGQHVTAVDTRGKAMLTRFEAGLTLYSHNQLYGRWYTSKSCKTPATRRSLRVAMHTEQGSAFLYSASDVDILDKSGLKAHPFLARLGPDILSSDIDAPTIAARLDEKRFRGRSLGSLFLDQHFLAGLGNYLRSEILFTAGLDPGLRPKDLNLEQRLLLGEETLLLAGRSYATRGLTLSPEQLENLPSRPRRRFWVFDREARPCYRCNSLIAREVRGSRRLYRCPGCQP